MTAKQASEVEEYMIKKLMPMYARILSGKKGIILSKCFAIFCILFFVVNTLDSRNFWYAHFAKLGMTSSLEYWFLTLGANYYESLVISFWRDTGGIVYSFAQTFPGFFLGAICFLALRFRRTGVDWGARFFSGYAAYFAVRGAIGSFSGRISWESFFSLMPVIACVLIGWYCYSHKGEEELPIIGSLLCLGFSLISFFSITVPLSQAFWYLCLSISFVLSLPTATNYRIKQREMQQSPFLCILVVIAFSAFNWLTGDALLSGGDYSYRPSTTYNEYDRRYDREEIWDFVNNYDGRW